MPAWLSKTLWIIGVLFVLTLINYVYQNHIEDRFFPKRWGEVVPGVMFRSGQLHEQLVEQTLDQYAIKTVVDLRYWEEDPHMIAERAAIERLSLESYRFPLNGNGTGDVESYIEALQVMVNNYRQASPVLVHCAAGSQRTSGAYALFGTLVLGLPVHVVIADMQNYGWKPVKNQILLDYLNEHVGYVAEQLFLRGLIDAVPQPLPHFKSE